MITNLYTLLELDNTASKEEVKEAYKKAILEHHPDKGGDQEQFIKLQEEYKLWKKAPEEYARTKYSKKPNPKQPLSDYFFRLLFRGRILCTPSDPLSKEYQKRHNVLVSTYRNTPLAQGNTHHHLKPFGIESSNDNNNVHSDNRDIFTLVRNKASHGAPSHFKIPVLPLSLEIAVDILIAFLEEKCYGTVLTQLHRYIQEGITTERTTHPHAEEWSFYTAVQDILALVSSVAPVDGKLLPVLQKIADYAKKTAPETLPVLAPLFQHRFFRQLFAQGLHGYWIDTAPWGGLHERGSLDGEQATRTLLEQKEQELEQETIRRDFDQEALRELEHERDVLLSNEEENTVAAQKLESTYEAIGTLQLRIKETETHLQHLEVYIPYVRMLLQYEEELNNISIPSSEAFRTKAYALIDWMVVLKEFASRSLSINVLLQAGLYFQKAAQAESLASVRMADEALALDMYLTVIALARHATPDIELYAYTHALKGITELRYAHTSLAKFIPSIQKHALILADIYPFHSALSANVAFIEQKGKGLALLRHYLGTLMEYVHLQNWVKDVAPKLEKNFHYKPSTVLYYTYKGALEGWYEANEHETRIQLMEALLAEEGWTFSHMQRNIDAPSIMVARDTEGWIQPTRSLPLPSYIQAFQSFEGMQVDYKTGDIQFFFKHWTEKDPDFTKRFTVLEFYEILERNLQGAIFSLDPVDPEKEYHPFNTMRFAPSSLYETEFMHTMFLTDYLLKFFTMGKEVQGRYPFKVQELKRLVSQLPPNLKQILADFQAAQTEDSVHRFWIEVEEVPVAFSEELFEKEGVERISVREPRMVVKKHRMKRDVHGNLIDQDEKQEGWNVYVMGSLQRYLLKTKIRNLQEPAMIFIKGSNEVFLLENGELSAPIRLTDYEKQYKGQLERFEQEELDKDGKVIRKSSNSWRHYRFIRSVAKAVRRPDHFTPEARFAEEFTAHYDEFSTWFPEFGRLKELSRITMGMRCLSGVRSLNQKKVDQLNNILADKKYWQKREQDINVSIEKIREAYKERFAQVKEQYYEQISTHFTNCAGLCSEKSVRDRLTHELQELYGKVGDLSVGENSSEVNHHCEMETKRIKAEITAKYGNNGWEQLKGEVKRGLDKQRPEIAKAYKEAKKKQRIDAVYNRYAEEFDKKKSEYSLKEAVKDFVVIGKKTDLINAIIKARIVSSKAEIQEYLQKEYPLVSAWGIQQALEGQHYLLEGQAEARAKAHLTQVKAEVEREIGRLQQIIPKEKQQLREQLRAPERLEGQFQEMGFGIKETLERDLKGKCLWVPAAVDHRKDKGHNRIVYGGVCVQPKMTMLGHDNPNRMTALNQVGTHDQAHMYATDVREAREESSARNTNNLAQSLREEQASHSGSENDNNRGRQESWTDKVGGSKRRSWSPTGTRASTSQEHVQSNSNTTSTHIAPTSLYPTQEITMSKGAIKNLYNDIKENGIRESVKYVEHEGNLYVVDGHHRLEVAVRLGLKEIPVEQVTLPYKGYQTEKDFYYAGQGY